MKSSIILHLAERPELPECPKDFRIGEKCNLPQNLECTKGQECCCGECYPSIKAWCKGGEWIGYYTDACLGPCSKNNMSKIPLR